MEKQFQKIRITDPNVLRGIAKQMDNEDRDKGETNRGIQEELENIADQLVDVKFLVEWIQKAFKRGENGGFDIEDMEAANDCLETIFNMKFETLEESKQRLFNKGAGK